MNRAVFLWLIACAIVPAFSQSNAGLSSEFEVASIKLAPANGPHGVWTNGSRNHIQMLGLNVKELISFAYDVEGYKVSAQGISAAEAYDVNAKIPDDVANLSDDARWARLHLLTQAMLADRFKVVLHHATTEMSVYVLSAAKTGSKIHETGPSRNENVRLDRREGHLSAKDMPMSQLVAVLRGELRKPVLDQTGIKGIFDITLDWAPETPARSGAADPTDTRPSLFTAVQEQLGLRLEAIKSPVDVLVIDHAEKPSEN